MIGCLQGKVLDQTDNKLLILTSSGVGYEVYFANEIINKADELLIHTTNIIKETSNELYGFLSSDEKKIFELLISVKGVGPKSAFSMVATIGPMDIVQAILMDNKKCLCSAPGIGKKAASQIVLDLADKITKFSNVIKASKHSPIDEMQQQDAFMTTSHPANDKFLNETIMACKELGFKENEISTLALSILKRAEITSSEQLIHQVLKEL